MKKLLGIVVLGLLWCNVGFAGVEEVLKEIKKNKDIAQGFNKVKEFDTWNEWHIDNKAILKPIAKIGSFFPNPLKSLI